MTVQGLVPSPPTDRSDLALFAWPVVTKDKHAAFWNCHWSKVIPCCLVGERLLLSFTVEVPASSCSGYVTCGVSDTHYTSQRSYQFAYAGTYASLPRPSVWLTRRHVLVVCLRGAYATDARGKKCWVATVSACARRLFLATNVVHIEEADDDDEEEEEELEADEDAAAKSMRRRCRLAACLLRDLALSDKRSSTLRCSRPINHQETDYPTRYAISISSCTLSQFSTCSSPVIAYS